MERPRAEGAKGAPALKGGTEKPRDGKEESVRVKIWRVSRREGREIWKVGGRGGASWLDGSSSSESELWGWGRRGGL